MPLPPLLSGLILLAILAAPEDAWPHDPSAYGGLFRSRDEGVTWFPANPGRIVSGALAVAVDPVNSQHLLLATDSGLLRSENGGLEWRPEAPNLLVGPVFAVAFAADGKRALAAGGAALFRSEAGAPWKEVAAPGPAMPARAIVPGEHDLLYLVGWRGLYRSDDGGASWVDIAGESMGAPATALIAPPRPYDIVFAIAGGTLWVSAAPGGQWRQAGTGLPGGQIETLISDGRHGRRLWAAGRGRVYRSDDAGDTWHPWGRAVGEPDLEMRGLAMSDDGAGAVVTTDRGLYRSADGGRRWDLLGGNLPAHLEAGPLVPDPGDPATLYAGFALSPYAALWRLAAERRPALARVGIVELAGAAAFLILLGLAGAGALQALARHERAGESGGPAPIRTGRGARM